VLLSWWTFENGWVFALVDDPTSTLYSPEEADDYVHALIAEPLDKRLTLVELWGVLRVPELRGASLEWVLLSGTALSFPPVWIADLVEKAAERNGVALKQGVYASE
jgi:hypothetical protein